MKPSTKRIILRIVHLVSVIPVLGYVYQPVTEAAEYQCFRSFVFARQRSSRTDVLIRNSPTLQNFAKIPCLLGRFTLAPV